MFKTTILIVISLTSFLSNADWVLDNKASNLNFVSTKKNTISEVNHFRQLSGQINPDGKAIVSIELTSVETNIPIRNERIMNYLFETDHFSTANVNADFESGLISTIKVGEVKNIKLPFMLNLHGHSVTLSTNVNLIKTKNNQMLVIALEPVILNANDFSLIKGINKLQELAGLSSINQAIPVSFSLVFNKQ
jgi:polyisoprenoid-binding protein YceI